MENALLGANDVRRDTSREVGGEECAFLASADRLGGSGDGLRGVADTLLVEAGEFRVAEDEFLGERVVRRDVESAFVGTKDVLRDTSREVGGEECAFLASADRLLGSGDGLRGVADTLRGPADEVRVAADEFLGERVVRRDVESAFVGTKDVLRDTSREVGGEGPGFLAAADGLHGVADVLLGAAGEVRVSADGHVKDGVAPLDEGRDARRATVTAHRRRRRAIGSKPTSRTAERSV